MGIPILISNIGIIPDAARIVLIPAHRTWCTSFRKLECFCVQQIMLRDRVTVCSQNRRRCLRRHFHAVEKTIEVHLEWHWQGKTHLQGKVRCDYTGAGENDGDPGR